MTQSGVDQVPVGEALANARRLLASHPEAAALQAEQIIAVEPGIAETYLILAAASRRLGKDDAAAAAEAKALSASVDDPTLDRVRRELADGKVGPAESVLRRFLADTPNDPEALRLLAAVAAQANAFDRAEDLLRRALSLAPSFGQARADLDALFATQARSLGDRTSDSKPSDPPSGLEEFAAAVESNERAVEASDSDPRLWLSYGHALRMAGRQSDSVAAYRKAIALKPDYGEAWWGLADLKTVEFDAADRDQLSALAENPASRKVDRVGLKFALGKAFADADLNEQAFAAFSEGNALKRKSVTYDPQQLDDYVERCAKTFTAEFFDERAGWGNASPDPILIVGMTRSGSTLLEHMLASHPMIEGTEELVYLGNLASFIGDGRRPGFEQSGFVDDLARSSRERLEAIGGAYLWRAEGHRRSSRPRFIDKMPRNWMYLPLIQLALPNARIIDVRRNPMDCLWSNFRQLFADAGEFSYDLTDLARHYRAYVRFMKHFDDALPGRVHRIFYEELIAQPEQVVRGALQYLDLPYDEACLNFIDNRRAVKTSSSEQVRRPINTDSLDQWRAFEVWLDPLRTALGAVGNAYPDVPDSPI